MKQYSFFCPQVPPMIKLKNTHTNGTIWINTSRPNVKMSKKSPFNIAMYDRSLPVAEGM